MVYVNITYKKYMIYIYNIYIYMYIYIHLYILHSSLVFSEELLTILKSTNRLQIVNLGLIASKFCLFSCIPVTSPSDGRRISDSAGVARFSGEEDVRILEGAPREVPQHEHQPQGAQLRVLKRLIPLVI